MTYQNSKEYCETQYKKVVEVKKKEEKMEIKAKKQMEKFFELHVKYLYSMQNLVKAMKKNPLAFKACSDVEIHCPRCGQKSIVSKMSNLDEFKCTNTECGFELSVKNLWKKLSKQRKELKIMYKNLNEYTEKTYGKSIAMNTKKQDCPACGHKTFNLYGDDLKQGKCFHPSCGLHLNLNKINYGTNYLNVILGRFFEIYPDYSL